MTAQQRMYLSGSSDKLVPHGHKEAAILYATPGTEIPEEAAKRFGLHNGYLTKKDADAGDKAAKATTRTADKARKAGGDKSGGGPPIKGETKRG